MNEDRKVINISDIHEAMRTNHQLAHDIKCRVMRLAALVNGPALTQTPGTTKDERGAVVGVLPVLAVSNEEINQELTEAIDYLNRLEDAFVEPTVTTNAGKY